KPSSGTLGFFQKPPILQNQFEEDTVLREIFNFYFPRNSPYHEDLQQPLTSFGDYVLSPFILDLVEDAEHNPPRLTTHTTFAVPKSKLITSHGWRALQSIGTSQGIVSIPYEGAEGHLSRMHQFVKYHLWSASCAITTCPAAMTDGAASLLHRHSGKNELFENAFSRLTSRNASQAWTSGQWMTERTGGSDVSGTETIATPINGQDAWSISGFKFFSSAADSNITILLAQTKEGLSAFLAHLPQENAITVQRLKNKVGTRPLPTAELVLTNMKGYLIGTPGSGIREISTMLNITRIHTAISALGFWGRGLAIARAYARVRHVARGALLGELPNHQETMALLHTRYAAHMHLGYFVVYLFGIVEAEESSFPSEVVLGIKTLSQAALLLRLLTPVLKAQASLAAVHGLYDAMQMLGGIGYLEEDMHLNIARLWRDTAVLPIWEGTVDVLAIDTRRVLE
ncbi:acyl-CoA dehydrogenase NM domain-like protein, partial [Piedraia hortae CBS 480.64]